LRIPATIFRINIVFIGMLVLVTVTFRNQNVWLRQQPGVFFTLKAFQNWLKTYAYF